tara:strand:- start:703 stop:1641 length:939 start_codon:yes stop_codon:yes gene_type:complete
MITKLKNIISAFLLASNEKNIFLSGSSHLSLAKFNYDKIKNLEEVDFKIFSQFGEDGILDFLLYKLNIKKPKFLEIGIGDYRECNTRYIYEKNSCKGMVVDRNKDLEKKISRIVKLWRGDLTIIEEVVTSKNILDIICKNNFDKNLDLFSLDIDGNDYWVLKVLPEKFSKIVVLEYNALFGPNLEITTPNLENFDREKYHYSHLCYGASLKAYIKLMSEKKFIFLGTNLACNNAFFVNEDEKSKLNLTLPNIEDLKKYTKSYIRDSRSPDGKLNYLSYKEKLKTISNCKIVDISQKEHRSILLKDLLSKNFL